jgi:hypothetical protein
MHQAETPDATQSHALVELAGTSLRASHNLRLKRRANIAPFVATVPAESIRSTTGVVATTSQRERVTASNLFYFKNVQFW